ncbi:MAG: hypothetical protein GQ582_08085 [Methyloprofundus sp.]|nr:hypothetical protein [Methyloprofundus sp.]
MRPPHEFYAYLPGSHFDGIDFSKHYRIGDNFLKLKVYAGNSHSTLREAAGPMNLPLVGANISYNTGNWHAKINYTYAHILDEGMDNAILDTLNSPELNQIFPDLNQLSSQISTKNKNGHYLSIGGSYDNGVWLAQAEASYTNVDSHALPSQASAYLSIGRRFSTVTLYTLYGISHSLEDRLNVPDPIVPFPTLEELQNILEYSLNQTGTDQQSLSLGMRWDFYENIAFKMQWSHYWLGTRQGTAQWSNPLATDKPHNVNVWSVGVDFIF